MSRKKARDNAFKCVYELEFGRDENIEKILKNCYEENNNNADEKEYIESVLKGIKENLAEIDNIILSKLKSWSFDRIAKIDLAILKLAKTYGNNDSKSFVNGVIAKVIESKEENNGTEENI